MGIDGRKKSILASFHGRYHTIGSADLRAVSTAMSPLYSGGFRSTDSEAMNIIPVYEICESVERSNYLKRKTRILEGSKAIAKHF
jgi:hypothetical protein